MLDISWIAIFLQGQWHLVRRHWRQKNYYCFPLLSIYRILSYCEILQPCKLKQWWKLSWHLKVLSWELFFYWVWVFNMYLVCDVSSSIQGCSLIHIGLNLALIHYWDFIWHLDFSGVKSFYNIVGLALCLYFSGTQSFTCYLGFIKSFK